MDRRIKLAIRLVIVALVAWGIWRAGRRAADDVAVRNSELTREIAELDERLRAAPPSAKAELLEQRDELRGSRLSWTSMRIGWLAASGAVCLMGMLPCWWYWHRTMFAMGQRPPWRRSLVAYYIGHLGKYVPGKAMVVVLRAGLVKGPAVDFAVAAAAVFVETLTMMAVGAAIAAAVLLATSQQTWTLVLALGLLVGAGVPTLPPVFRRVVQLIQARRASPLIDDAAAGLDYRLMATGWMLTAFGWAVQGASLWCALRATGVEPQWRHLPLLTACLALAIVAGFVSLIPGGLGIRELVVTELLATEFSPAAALGAAVMLRISWLVSELVISGILYLLFARSQHLAAPPLAPASSSPSS